MVLEQSKVTLSGEKLHFIRIFWNYMVLKLSKVIGLRPVWFSLYSLVNRLERGVAAGC